MAATKLSVYDQVKALAAGGTAAAGELFGVSDTSGTIAKLAGITYASNLLTINANTGSLPAVMAVTPHVRIGGADAADAGFLADVFATGKYPAFIGRHARGTAASPSALASGDVLFALIGYGYGSTGYTSTLRAGVFGSATQTWTDANNGTCVRVFVTADGSATAGEMARFDQNGGLHLGDGLAANCRLDVKGAAAFRQGSLTLSNGLNSNISSPATGYSYYRVTGPTGNFSVGGFTGGVDGRLLVLHNTVATHVLTIVNEDASSTAANRITTLSGANVVMRAGACAATFIYSTADSRWILIETN